MGHYRRPDNRERHAQGGARRHVIDFEPVPWDECLYRYGSYDQGGGDPSVMRLLEVMPEWKPRLGEMRKHGAVWSALVDEWDNLTALYAAAEKAVASRPLQLHVTPEELDFYVAIRQCTESAREEQR